MAESVEVPNSRVCVCRSQQEVESLISEIQETTQCRYVIWHVDKSFKDEDWQPSFKSKIYFEKKNYGKSPSIPFSGSPFTFIGNLSLACHQGKDRGKSAKRKYAEKKIISGDHKHERFLVQDTKKVDCPAYLKVTRVATFLDEKFQIEKNKKWKRKMSAEALKHTLEFKRDEVTWENIFYVYLPQIEDHVGHPIIGEVASIHETVDPRVEERIKKLTKHGLDTSVTEMQKFIKEFVRNNIFKGGEPPPLLHRRYFPLDRDVWNIMKRAQNIVNHSSDDQVNLQNLVQSWKERDSKNNIFLRVHQGNQNFLLCLQTKWQRRLLHMYGKDVCLLDSSHKPTNEFSQLFLYVRTNVCYVAVAVIFIQQETTDAVSEALKVLKDWNEGWSPGYFIVDFSKSEIEAAESIFPGCKAVLNDFHREKAWGEWMTKPCHGVENQDEALSLLRRIASADTIDKYHKAVKKLQDSEEWTRNSLFQHWFQTEWMPVVRRWVTVFREETLHINITTNNGIERLNETFKYSHLINHKANTISENMSIVVDEFIPEMHKKYSQLNLQFSSGYKKYNNAVPTFLHNRPRDMVRHILQRFKANLGPDHVTKVANGQFEVRSESGIGSLLVSLGSISTDSLPSCDCDDWKKNMLPCKHFCAVFKIGWTWDDLCPKYRDNPLFTLDPLYFTSSCDPQPIEEPEDNLSPNEGKTNNDYLAWKENETNFPQKDEGVSHDLLIRKNPKSNIHASKCVESLKNLINLISLLEDGDYLKNMEVILQDLEEKVQSHIPQKARMALYCCSQKRKLDMPTVDDSPLPKIEYGCSDQSRKKILICGCHQPKIVSSSEDFTLKEK